MRALERLHIDLVCGISPNHMEDCQSSSRMLVEPGVKLQYSPFGDDNDVAVSNQTLNFTSREGLVIVHEGGWHYLMLKERRRQICRGREQRMWKV